MEKLGKTLSDQEKKDGVFPTPPTEYSEAAAMLQETKKTVDMIKQVLHAAGMVYEKPGIAWEPVWDDGDLLDRALRITLDVNMIKMLLTDAGLADETEFIPLSPRWRVDGDAHHNRNFVKFEKYVRRIIYAVKSNIPASKSVYDFDKKVRLL